MLTYGFYDSLSGDRKYKASQFGDLFDGIIRDGVFLSWGDKFNVSPGSGMKVIVGTGKAWFNKTWTVNDSAYEVSIGASDITRYRRDVVVLDVNQSTDVRANTIKIVQGSYGASSSVSSQALIRDNINKHWQYPIAEILVKPGVSSISAADIVQKVGLADTPYVTGILQTTSAASLFSTWEAEWNALITSIGRDPIATFDTRLSGLEDHYRTKGVVLGQANGATIGDYSISIGATPNTLIPNYSFAHGNNVMVGDVGAHAEGKNTKAEGSYSHAEGDNGTTNGTASHVEGYGCKIESTSALNSNYAHAEGSLTIARGVASHTEGYKTVTMKNYAHAEGRETISNGNAAHAEGFGTATSGDYSHAEGSGTVASGDYSHAEGYTAQAKGVSSHAEGHTTTTYGDKSHSEGFRTVARGEGSHAEGDSTQADGDWSHAEGQSTEASGKYSHTEGNSTIASNDCAHAEGWGTKASDFCAHAEGNYSKATYANAHAEGSGTQASANAAHAEGVGTIAGYEGSHAEGMACSVVGGVGHAEGNTTQANGNQHVTGHYNKKDATAATSSGSSTDNAFIIGNGTASTQSNAFRVQYNGATYAKGAYSATGADYAELFEWEDQNPTKENRKGLFVTMVGDRIKIASPGDWLLGVVSAAPCVLGNIDMEWSGQFLKDEFGEFIMEHKTDIEKYVDLERQIKINPETGEERVEMVEVEKEREIEYDFYKVNPEYDPEKPYTPRLERPEWAAIGMLGVLAVYDDGTCQVNGFCKCAQNGTATATDDTNGYRVIKRVSENIVNIIFR